jgi:hypothetical protein
MTRGVGVLATAASIVGLLVFAPSAFAAPRLTLTPSCDLPNTPFGFDVTGTGFPPNQAVNVITPNARVRTGTDVDGRLSPVFFGSPPPGFGFLRVLAYEIHDLDLDVDPDEALLATAFIDNPCGPPTLTKDQCRKGGWRDFDFKGQGQCIRFVQQGPKE